MKKIKRWEGDMKEKEQKLGGIKKRMGKECTHTYIHIHLYIYKSNL